MDDHCLSYIKKIGKRNKIVERKIGKRDKMLREKRCGRIPQLFLCSCREADH
jgi:hypothetical protein